MLSRKDKYRKIAVFVQSCEVCNQVKLNRNRRVVDKTIRIVDEVNQMVSVDVMKVGKIPVLVVIDEFSKYIRCKVMTAETGEVMQVKLLEIFMEMSPPQALKSDNGGAFISDEVKELMEVYNVHHTTIIAGNSQGNSMAENAIGRLQVELRIISPEKDNIGEIEMAVAIAAFKLNSKLIKGSNYSPFEIVYLKNPNILTQLPDLSKTKVSKFSTSMRNAYKRSEEIREDILSKKKNVLKDLEAMSSSKVRYKKNDLVKVKTVQKVGEIKKTFKPYTTKNYKVLKVLPFCNSLFVEEISNSEKVRPNRRRVHFNQVKLVRKRGNEFDSQDEIVCGDKGTNDSKVDKCEKGGTCVENVVTDELIDNDDLNTQQFKRKEVKALFERPNKTKYNLRVRKKSKNT